MYFNYQTYYFLDQSIIKTDEMISNCEVDINWISKAAAQVGQSVRGEGGKTGRNPFLRRFLRVVSSA